MINEPFFTSDTAWNIRKDLFLSGYLDRLNNNGGSAFKEFFAIDTFACPAGRRTAALPPLDKAERSGARLNSTGVKLVRVLTRNETTNGHAATPWFPADPNLVAESEGALEQLFPRVVSIVARKPAMLFLDPYGASRLSFTSLKPFLRRKQNHTELIIRFDAESVWREATALCLEQCGHSTHCRTLARQLAKVLGVDGVTEVASAGPAAALVKNYVSQLTQFGFFVGVHKIRDDIDLPMSHYLFYCTRKRENLMIANNIVRTAEDQVLSTYYREKGIDESATELERDHDLRRLELKFVIKDYAARLGPRSGAAIKWQIVFDRFGDFHEEDFEAQGHFNTGTDAIYQTTTNKSASPDFR